MAHYTLKICSIILYSKNFQNNQSTETPLPPFHPLLRSSRGAKCYALEALCTSTGVHVMLESQTTTASFTLWTDSIQWGLWLFAEKKVTTLQIWQLCKLSKLRDWSQHLLLCLLKAFKSKLKTTKEVNLDGREGIFRGETTHLRKG